MVLIYQRIFSKEASRCCFLIQYGFAGKVRFLQRQFLQDGDLPFTDILSVDAISQSLTEAEIVASSEESVGEFSLGQCPEVVIQGDFVGVLGAKAIRFSGDQF